MVTSFARIKKKLSSLGVWLLSVPHLLSVGSLACVGSLHLILICFPSHFVFSIPKMTILGELKPLTIYQLLKNSVFHDQSMFIIMPFHLGQRKTAKT